MRARRTITAGLVCLALLTAVTRAQSQSPARLIPAEADLVLEIKNPRVLAETFTKLDAVKELQKLDAVKELYDSTKYRRFFQLVSYYEKELGAPWPELLDKLAGNGIAIGAKPAGKETPVLLAAEGKDEAAMKKFVELALKVIEQELARQEAKVSLEKTKYQDVDVYSLGKEFHLALTGKMLLVTNHPEAIKKGLDLALGREKKSAADSTFATGAAKILPKDALVTFWANLDEVHKTPGAKEFYKNPRDPGLTALVGHYVDVFSRSPFICASFGKDGDSFLLTARLPAGRDGIGPDRLLHLNEDDKTGTRPVLEPKNIIYSSSFYYDFAKIWEERVKIFGEQNAKGIEKADMEIGKVPFLGGVSLSKTLPQFGPYQRIVIVNQEKGPYTKQPKTKLPAFAFITEMRDPDGLGQKFEGLLRGAALFGGNQVGGVVLKEEKHNDLNILSYRFDEERAFKQDVNDIRFNFTPSFVRVGNQYVFCSSLDLCKELIDLLQAEAKEPAKKSPATTRDRYYSAGIADILTVFEQPLVTQGVLDLALPPEKAKEQVEAFITLVRNLGVLSTDLVFEEKMSRYDIRLKIKK
jgi:hypothetical protein